MSLLLAFLGSRLLLLSRLANILGLLVLARLRRRIRLSGGGLIVLVGSLLGLLILALRAGGRGTALLGGILLGLFSSVGVALLVVCGLLALVALAVVHLLLCGFVALVLFVGLGLVLHLLLGRLGLVRRLGTFLAPALACVLGLLLGGLLLFGLGLLLLLVLLVGFLLPLGGLGRGGGQEDLGGHLDTLGLLALDLVSEALSNHKSGLVAVMVADLDVGVLA